MQTKIQTTQAPWQIVHITRQGAAHAARNKPCEDNVAHQFQAHNAIAIAVADGVSGGALGHIASATAVQACVQYQPQTCTATVVEATRTLNNAITLAPSTLTEALVQAAESAIQITANNARSRAHLQTHLNTLDATVQQALTRHTARSGATTLAAAWLSSDGQGFLTHVGDVRAYLYTPSHEPEPEPVPAPHPQAHEETKAANPTFIGIPCYTGTTPAEFHAHRCPNLGHLQPLTVDETYANLAQTPPANVPADNPARMCGNGTGAAPVVQAIRVEPNQILMLCTDGLHGFVNDLQLTQIFNQQTDKNPQARLAALGDTLLHFALANGSDDDIGILLLQHN